MSWRDSLNRSSAVDAEVNAVSIFLGKKTRKSRDPHRLPTLADVAPLFLVEYRPWRNVETSSAEKASEITRRSLLPFFGALAVAKISSGDVSKFVVQERTRHLAGHSPSEATIRNYLSALSMFFKWARYKRLCDMNPVDAYRAENPSRRVDRGAEIEGQVLTLDEIHSVFREAKSMGLSYARAFAVFLMTGLRRGELAALRDDDVVTHDLMGRVLAQPYLKVERQIVVEKERGVFEKDYPKGKSRRKVPVNQVALAALQAQASELHNALRPGKQMPLRLFPEIAENPVRFSNLYMRKICVKAGIPRHKRRLHGVRHTFAGLLKSQKIGPRDLQLLLGHTTVRMAERYGQIFDNPSEGVTACLEGALLASDNSSPEPPESTSLPDNVVHLGAHRRKWTG